MLTLHPISQSSFSLTPAGEKAEIWQMRAVYRTPAGLRWLLQSHLPPKRPSPGLSAASWGSPRQWAIPTPTDTHLPRRPVATSCPGIRFSLTDSDNCVTNLSWWPPFKPAAPTQLFWVSGSLKFLIKRSIADRYISCHWKVIFHVLLIKYHAAIWNDNYIYWPKKLPLDH